MAVFSWPGNTWREAMFLFQLTWTTKRIESINKWYFQKNNSRLYSDIQIIQTKNLQIIINSLMSLRAAHAKYPKYSRRILYGKPIWVSAATTVEDNCRCSMFIKFAIYDLRILPFPSAKMHVHQPGVFERRVFLIQKRHRRRGMWFLSWGVSQELWLTEWVWIFLLTFQHMLAVWVAFCPKSRNLISIRKLRNMTWWIDYVEI